jgi:hypothetical protein
MSLQVQFYLSPDTHKINGDCIDLNSTRLDGRAGIEHAGSALAPKDREVISYTPFPRARQTGRG